MKKSSVIKILIFLFFCLIMFFFYSNFFKEKEDFNKVRVSPENNKNSNVIKDVNYISKDSKGNEYILNATEGEIDLSNSNTIFLTNVRAIINLIDSSEINIISDFGKYNIDNYDTIFSKNVIITYVGHKIVGNYLDFSLNRNSMIISKNVVYNSDDKVLRADIVEINIKTKDTKIFMYEQNKKVNIKSIN